MPVSTRLTFVWFVLLALTVGSTWISTSARIATSGSVMGIMGFALLKVYFVGTEFMELRHAPSALRWAFTAWALALWIALSVVAHLPSNPA